MEPSFFSLLCVFVFFGRAEPYYGHGLIRCDFTSATEVVYLEQIFFNKVLIGQYNSTVEKFFGYTNYTRELAEKFNQDPGFLRQEKKNKAQCETIAALASDDILSITAEPYVRLKSAKEVGTRHPHVLVCSVYKFYPKQINVTWLRDGETVTSDVTLTDVLASGNWLYQIHSHLEYLPRPGEKITCKVEHASFDKPKLYDWNPLLESQREKIAVGTAGVVLGSLFLLIGAICYRKNSSGRVLVPTG